MYIVDRTVRFVRGFVMSYGPSKVKKKMWNEEFSGGKWHFIDDTLTDCIYPHLEKFANKGTILDLGCGPGNTANELVDTAYRSYVGVDISEEALAKAEKRTAANRRTHKNRFVCSDLLSYQPDEKFDVVLFRESMYHIPLGKIKPILDKYSPALTKRGVFIVRMYASENGNVKWRPSKMFRIIEDNFDVVEKAEYDKSGAVVIIFRPKPLVRR